MEIEITDKKNNQLLKRTEVHFIIKHENQGTPNKAIMRNELAEALNAKKDQIIIDRVESSFGIQETKGYAKVYSSRKEAEDIERKHILKRNKVSESKPKKKEEKSANQDTASEEKTEEKPVEEEKKEDA